MKIIDLMAAKVASYEKREVNVLYQNDIFKTRLIELEAGGSIPDCQMATYVLFQVINGQVDITRNGETSHLRQGMLLITEPALLSMKSDEGARLLGIQIKAC